MKCPLSANSGHEPISPEDHYTMRGVPKVFTIGHLFDTVFPTLLRDLLLP